MHNWLLIMKCLLIYVWISSSIFAVTNYFEGEFVGVGIHLALVLISAYRINQINGEMEN